LHFPTISSATNLNLFAIDHARENPKPFISENNCFFILWAFFAILEGVDAFINI